MLHEHVEVVQHNRSYVDGNLESIDLFTETTNCTFSLCSSKKHAKQGIRRDLEEEKKTSMESFHDTVIKSKLFHYEDVCLMLTALDLWLFSGLCSVLADNPNVRLSTSKILPLFSFLEEDRISECQWCIMRKHEKPHF